MFLTIFISPTVNTCPAEYFSNTFIWGVLIGVLIGTTSLKNPPAPAPLISPRPKIVAPIPTTINSPLETSCFLTSFSVTVRTSKPNLASPTSGIK